jgi:spore germination cell wall hydrolase CwlJ-like protein
MTYDQNDHDSMALCVWKESRGEGQAGMSAVANVILNRARAWYSHITESVHAAVYAKNQFTSMSVPSDPEFSLTPHPNDPQYAYCDELCTGLLANADGRFDPTHGALYYANLAESTSGWFFDNIVKSPAHPLLATIGKQNFYQ